MTDKQLATAAISFALLLPLIPRASLAQASDDAFTYSARGRRDPFDAALPVPAGGCEHGVSADQVSLMGIVLSAEQGPIAVVMGPDDKGLFLHPGDALCDGEVGLIEADRLVLLVKNSSPLEVSPFRKRILMLDPQRR